MTFPPTLNKMPNNSAIRIRPGFMIVPHHRNYCLFSFPRLVRARLQAISQLLACSCMCGEENNINIRTRKFVHTGSAGCDVIFAYLAASRGAIHFVTAVVVIVLLFLASFTSNCDICPSFVHPICWTFLTQHNQRAGVAICRLLVARQNTVRPS